MYICKVLTFEKGYSWIKKKIFDRNSIKKVFHTKDLKLHVIINFTEILKRDFPHLIRKISRLDSDFKEVILGE